MIANGGKRDTCALAWSLTIQQISLVDVKSFVDDLALGRGVVLSRAATTLRSIETKPFGL